MAIEVEQLEAHRQAVMGHCYRMLGSPFEAEDAVQETMVRAWRSFEGFDGRASLQTWLYRIATNVCLDALHDRSRRFRPMEEGPVWSADTPPEKLQKRPARHWLEPVPDQRVIPEQCDPATKVALRQSIRLAFVAALQHLPPKQRAALLLTEVLGWSVAEVAETLATTPASINSALQRARASLHERGEVLSQPPKDLSSEQTSLVERFTQAFEAYDVDALTRLLTADVVMAMPPYSLWLQGPTEVARWLRGTGIGCKDSRLLPVCASGRPAFAQYRAQGSLPWALISLDVSDAGITTMTYFLDTQALFPLFGLPARL